MQERDAVLQRDLALGDCSIPVAGGGGDRSSPKRSPLFGITTAVAEHTLALDLLSSWLEANGFGSHWFGKHSDIPVDLKSEQKPKEIPEADV
jgi:hypothetical protein